jgi:Xaa-Pro aminopeptidase
MTADDLELAKRANNRSRTPDSQKFVDYIGSNWQEKKHGTVAKHPVADFAKTRRSKLAARFAGELVVIRAGAEKTRSNDTEYRFRAHAAFAHMTGWGSATVAESVLVIDARKSPSQDILFLRPTKNHSSSEFFANPAIGEFWVGSRPSLEEVSSLLNIETRDLDELTDFLKGQKVIDLESSDELNEFVSEVRLVKDSYEIAELRKAIESTARGFEDIVRALPQATGVARGERVIETAFFARARHEGNDLGYETIAAAGKNACTLHWIANHGDVIPGELVLVDAGVEMDSLYTADITRTLPISGAFSEVQKKIYLAVLEAADAAFAVAKPGVKYREIHAVAMAVIAKKTAEWGFLPATAEESLQPENQYHRRWMIHGTGHHLGIDVHDCALARKEMYVDAELEPGMVFTIEPGLYFHPDDLMVPEEFRGIGIRIEDDVLVTESGVENLSAMLPRTPEAIEAWMKSLAG